MLYAIIVDAAAIGGRRMLLPGEIPLVWREVSRSHSRFWKRAVNKRRRSHRKTEGLNVKLSQML